MTLWSGHIQLSPLYLLSIWIDPQTLGAVSLRQENGYKLFKKKY